MGYVSIELKRVTHLLVTSSYSERNKQANIYQPSVRQSYMSMSLLGRGHWMPADEQRDT